MLNVKSNILTQSYLLLELAGKCSLDHHNVIISVPDHIMVL